MDPESRVSQRRPLGFHRCGTSFTTRIFRPKTEKPVTFYEDEEFLIRSLEERDLPALEWDGQYLSFRRLFRQSFDDMRAGTRLLLVLVRKPARDIIGQLFIQWNSGDMRLADGIRRGYLYSLRVKAEFRGRGLGTRLLLTAEEILRRRKMETASIGVEKTNLRARALYERLGYQIMGEDPGRWSYTDHLGEEREVSEPAWLMEKKIT
jgi:ribosomal protein S18 acetylase RimI-like enzyme